MFKTKYLVFSSLIFITAFAEQDSFIDKTKKYSKSSITVIKNHARKSKDFIKRHKIKSGLVTFLCISAYGYHGLKTNKNYSSDIQRLAWAPIAGILKLIAKPIDFTRNQYERIKGYHKQLNEKRLKNWMSFLKSHEVEIQS
ncbi:hypothetical protein M1446_03560 [Candidatus Dependentiae bacterium]|nr:hypothetical protein [Candidatus Dependentiae bacterium]